MVFASIAYLSYQSENNKINAHALDTTLTSIFYDQDYTGNVLESNELYMVFSSNWIQIAAIIDGQEPSEILSKEALLTKESEITSYLKSELKVSNNGKHCQYNFNELFIVSPELIELAIIDLEYIVDCEADIKEITVVNNSYFPIAPLQRNELDILDGKDLTISASNDFTPLNDDSFTYDIILGKKISNDNTGGQSFSERNTNFVDSFFTNLVAAFQDKVNNFSFSNTYFVIGVSLLIGMFHALESGHGKLILASVIIDNKFSLKKSSLFAAVFTLSHMSDIFLFALLLIFVDFQYPQLLTSQIRFYALIVFIIISLYLCLKAVKSVVSHYKRLYNNDFNHSHHDHHHHVHGHHHHHHEHNHHGHHHHDISDENKSLKEYLLLAFTSGLAPCLTGWLVLTTIFTTGNFILIFPVLLAFTLGIYIVEIIFALSVSYFRIKVGHILDNINHLVHLFSATLLFSIGIFSLFQTYLIFIIPIFVFVFIIRELLLKSR